MIKAPGKLVAWLASGLLLGFAAAGVLYWQFLSWADAPISDTESFRLTLQPGQTLSSLADELQSQEHLQDTRRLVLLGKLTGVETRLQAGEYLIERATTPRQMLGQLMQGDVVTYDFRIVEGATVADVLRSMADDDRLRHQVVAGDAESLHAELSLDTEFAEGTFLPETYQFRRGDSDRVLLDRAHQAMLGALDSVWQQRASDLTLTAPAELLVLASIIEKETGIDAERAQISQVFHKRLQERMLLQTDPTVIYALGDDFDGNLTRAHLKIDSPFNTYRFRGLPPTPIALPSSASLTAAAQPATGEFLYFVARGDGTSQFSHTLVEHNRAVRRYQLNRGSLDEGS